MSENVVKLQPEADLFDEFWQRYPRRIGKPLARSKWNAITGSGLRTRTLDRDSNTYVELELKATPEELIEGAKRYYSSQLDQNYKFRDGGKYICHPATWLNQGRWMDEQ